MKSIPWDNPDSNILDDIASVVKMVREDSGISPETILCNLKTYAYLVLGHLVTVISFDLKDTLNYQLPKSTITDHLKDCFGWITC